MATNKTFDSGPAPKDHMNGYFHMASYEERSIGRSQAMEKLQPMLDKLDQCTTTTADFMADIEASFTPASVKVLPQYGKRIIRLAAEAVGNREVLEWIAAAKDDTEDFTWLMPVVTVKPPAELTQVILEDLAVLVEAAPSNIQEQLRSQVKIIDMSFKWFERYIRENTIASDTNSTINEQLR
ncbi:hypothetical protein GGI43DRAFT_383347 [Trichoderma evansii]